MVQFDASFVKMLPQLKLLQLFKSLTPRERVVVDRKLVASLRRKWPGRAKQFIAADAVDSELDSADTVYVLMAAYSPQMCARLQDRYPSSSIVDVVYGLLPRLLIEQALPDIKALQDVSPEAAPQAAHHAMPTFVLAGQGSEVELLLSAVETAGMGAAVEVFPTAVQRLLETGMRFSLLRFLAGFVRAMSVADHMFLVLRPAILYGLHNSDNRPKGRLRKSMAKWGVKVLHWQMRDRCRQIVLAQHYMGQPLPSVYAMTVEQRRALKQRPYALTRMIEFLPDIVGADAFVSRRIGNLDGLIALTYEDFCRQPAKVIEALSSHIHRAPTTAATLPDINLSARYCSELDDRARRLAWDLVDHLGLHATTKGSTMPFSQSLLRREGGS